MCFEHGQVTVMISAEAGVGYRDVVSVVCVNKKKKEKDESSECSDYP
jgi:hypothetical protein